MEMTLGVGAPGKDPFGNSTWNILGQTYQAIAVSDRAMLWHATLPAETFVPPHVHPTQDEWITVLSGELEVDFITENGVETMKALPTETARMPMGLPHGVYNRSGAEATAVFGVAPTQKLFELFKAINNVPDPAEVVRLAGLHEVDFLPPLEGS
ncbi:MAG: cupin domain-containing protein [Pseudomonadota bacterium]